MDGCLNGHNVAFKPKEHGLNLLKRRNCDVPGLKTFEDQEQGVDTPW
ncbi:uncharacterized protein G2W53_010729 [Senna tora]|uniref:Uncharacterized protein n=1 Tax=Senna tora TaxID=362788 RepID=A0A834X1F0_9FABA|nr:uncharacterized protein G2W53_010729 [Senna tora]